MKIKMKQHKLISFLEKLYMSGAYPVATIIIEEKNDKTVLRSIQKEAGARSLRYFMAKQDYFDELESSEVPFILEVEKIIKVIKNIASDEDITITKQGERISVKSNRVNLNLNYQIVGDEEIIEKLPLKMIDGIPYFGKKVDVPLSTKFDIKLSELKDIISYAGSIDTNTYQFVIANKKLNVRIGDIHKLDDYIIFDSNVSVDEQTSLDVIFTYGINEIANTFQQPEFTIYTDTDKPMLAQERSENYKLGVFLPPYTKE